MTYQGVCPLVWSVCPDALGNFTRHLQNPFCPLPFSLHSLFLSLSLPRITPLSLLTLNLSTHYTILLSHVLQHTASISFDASSASRPLIFPWQVKHSRCEGKRWADRDLCQSVNNHGDIRAGSILKHLSPQWQIYCTLVAETGRKRWEGYREVVGKGRPTSFTQTLEDWTHKFNGHLIYILIFQTSELLTVSGSSCYTWFWWSLLTGSSLFNSSVSGRRSSSGQTIEFCNIATLRVLL